MSILLLADAKLHARITIDDDDTLIQGQIDAAETWLGLFLGAPLSAFMTASFTGAIAGTALTVSNAVGTIAIGQALSGAGVTGGTTITAGFRSLWAVSASQNVSAEAMTSAGTLPDPLLEALRQLVGFMYDNREAAVVGNFNLTQVSPGFYDLISPYRTFVF